MVLYSDCYALCLPWVSLGRVGPVGPALQGGVHVWGFVGFVGRVLFSLGSVEHAE